MNQVVATIKDIEIISSPQLVPYQEALNLMEQRVEGIIAGTSPQALWFLEHPPIYTAGTSADMADLLSNNFPVYEAGRGGQLTYHGPGQRVVYAMLDLNRRPAAKTKDLRAYVCDLEKWIIATLAQFGIKGETRQNRIGVWVVRDDGGEDKIAALGIRVRKYVAFHGIALNVNPNLAHFAGIVPCGIKEHGVTSMHALGVKASMTEVDAALRENFSLIFGSA